MKLRITISKYHSWYLRQISLQIMLLPIQRRHNTNENCLFGSTIGQWSKSIKVDAEENARLPTGAGTRNEPCDK